MSLFAISSEKFFSTSAAGLPLHVLGQAGHQHRGRVRPEAPADPRHRDLLGAAAVQPAPGPQQPGDRDQPDQPLPDLRVLFLQSGIDARNLFLAATGLPPS